MPLIHVSLEPCIACVHHLRVIDLGNCLLCVEVMHHSAIHLTVLVKAKENSQLRLQHACVPRRSFKYLLCKIQLSLLGIAAATRQSAQVTSDGI
jgi:hypothetical protein